MRVDGGGREDNDTNVTVYMEGYMYPIEEKKINGANGLIEQSPLAHRGNISLTPPPP